MLYPKRINIPVSNEIWDDLVTMHNITLIPRSTIVRMAIEKELKRLKKANENK